MWVWTRRMAFDFPLGLPLGCFQCESFRLAALGRCLRLLGTLLSAVARSHPTRVLLRHCVWSQPVESPIATMWLAEVRFTRMDHRSTEEERSATMLRHGDWHISGCLVASSEDHEPAKSGLMSQTRQRMVSSARRSPCSAHPSDSRGSIVESQDRKDRDFSRKSDLNANFYLADERPNTSRQ